MARTGDDEFALLVPQPDGARRLGRASTAARERQRGCPRRCAGPASSSSSSPGRWRWPASGSPSRSRSASRWPRPGVPTWSSWCAGRRSRSTRRKPHELAVATYDSSQDAVTTDGLALLAELRDALAADDQIVLDLQPAVDLVTAAPTGVEALVRWQHPRRGRLSPGDFIRTVEHTELLAPFTRRVLDLRSGRGGRAGRRPASTCRSRSTCRPAACSTRPSRPRSPTRCAGTGLPASSLVLEITESVAVSEQDDRRRRAGRAAGQRGAAVAGRLRHRLLVAVDRDPRAGRRDQDRPVLRGRHDRPRGGRGGGPGRRRTGRPTRRTGGGRRASRPPSSGRR